MKCWGMYWGGGNYSQPIVRDDTEFFSSIKEAKRVFEYRTLRDLRYPCTDNRACMQIWLRDPREERDPYPDKVIEFGPLGGIKETAC